MKTRNPLYIPLFILFILLIIFFVIGMVVKNEEVGDYFSNLSIEILGAIITLIFIDLYLSRHEKRIAEKREKIAWTLLRPIIHSNLSILFTIYKAASKKQGKNYETNELSEFLGEDFIVTIQHFNVIGSAPIFPDMSWIDYLKIEFEKINKRYNEVLDKYSIHMEPELVEILEEIINSRFHKHLIDINPSLFKYNVDMSQDFFRRTCTRKYHIEPYVNNVKTLLNLASKVEIMDNFFKITDLSWDNKLAPQIGSSRID